MIPTHHDVIIVGGGIIGGGIAEQLRCGSRLRVSIVEQELRARVKTGASQAAAGGINPHLYDEGHGALGPMAQRSRDLYPDWIERLRVAWGQPIELRRSGLLCVAIEEKEHDRLINDVLPLLRERGVPAEELGADEARRREPLLGSAVTGGLWLPDDLAVEPLRVMAALEALLKADNGLTCVPDHAEDISADADGVRVVLRSGRVLRSDKVVVAAGHLSHELVKDFIDWRDGDFSPVKGQILEVEAPVNGGLRTQCDALVRDDNKTHIVRATPYAEGRVAVGVTHDRGDASTGTSPRASESILRNLRRILPDVAGWKVIGARAGIRPGTSDGLPVLGYVDPHRRVLAASGHNGLGITLAPRTAQLAVKLLLDTPLTEEDRADLHVSRPERLAASPSR
ncbi:FAD-dependent oxidoreductase [Actinomadura sp. KC06]|uniref:NAD(P)/FAD-dependent oxidoreductase n=1 Tax=Actinomadura sp. KC06 TaxID=2530369 RepID=UPI00104C883C|nr:FAD-dependent oxidoreductase [Actinomadura sp. KC06]TDD37527.1 FAD-dependent oxidoreductase [Actinomadura sp. KC06]